MSGPEATKTLRAHGYKGVILGVTGNALADDIQHFMSCGADMVLSKPVDPEVLLKAIEDMLGHRRVRRSTVT